MFLPLGISLVFSSCHPELTENDRLGRQAIGFLEEYSGKGTDSLKEYLTNPDVGWYCSNEILRTRKRDNPNIYQSSLLVAVRDEKIATVFHLTFGIGGNQ